jgi:hypothetical protein
MVYNFADPQLQQDLEQFVTSYKNDMEHDEYDEFRKIFWREQVTALSVKVKQGIWWHPLFLRLCINIVISSPKTYNIIQDSNFIVLLHKKHSKITLIGLNLSVVFSMRHCNNYMKTTR